MTEHLNSLKRFRVRVAFPKKGHRGFIVWAESSTLARRKVRRHGYIVRHVKREERPN